MDNNSGISRQEPDYFVTDCCCPNCGKRHKSHVDFNNKPARVFGYYQVFCPICVRMTPLEKAAYAKAMSALIEGRTKGRRRK